MKLKIEVNFPGCIKPGDTNMFNGKVECDLNLEGLRVNTSAFEAIKIDHPDTKEGLTGELRRAWIEQFVQNYIKDNLIKNMGWSWREV